jgi:hypothetical protein
MSKQHIVYGLGHSGAEYFVSGINSNGTPKLAALIQQSMLMDEAEAQKHEAELFSPRVAIFYAQKLPAETLKRVQAEAKKNPARGTKKVARA